MNRLVTHVALGVILGAIVIGAEYIANRRTIKRVDRALDAMANEMEETPNRPFTIEIG